MKKTVLSVLLFLTSVVPVFAGPKEDAAYIAEQVMSDDVLSVVFDALGSMLTATMIVEYQKQGVELSNDASATITQMMLRSMKKRVGPKFRQLYADLYLKYLTPGELVDYRAFLETASGLKVMAIAPDLAKEAGIGGEKIGANMGMAAFADIAIDVENRIWPEGTSEEVKGELIELFGR